MALHVNGTWLGSELSNSCDYNKRPDTEKGEGIRFVEIIDFIMSWMSLVNKIRESLSLL